MVLRSTTPQLCALSRYQGSNHRLLVTWNHLLLARLRSGGIHSMTPANLSGRSGDARNRAEFEARLQQLIADARDEGVQVLGAYDVRSLHQKDQDYQVEITGIRKRPQE